jgi:hypothetical protein
MSSQKTADSLIEVGNISTAIWLFPDQEKAQHLLGALEPNF